MLFQNVEVALAKLNDFIVPNTPALCALGPPLHCLQDSGQQSQCHPCAKQTGCLLHQQANAKKVSSGTAGCCCCVIGEARSLP
jgi:hypothetical protein